MPLQELYLEAKQTSPQSLYQLAKRTPQLTSIKFLAWLAERSALLLLMCSVLCMLEYPLMTEGSLQGRF